MVREVILSFLAFVACVLAASISGNGSLDTNQISLGGQIVFPKIPGINAPLFGNFFGNSNENSGNNGNATSGNGNSTQGNHNFTLPSLSALANIPGLSTAINMARNHVKAALDIAGDLSDGIEKLVEEALIGPDPVAAINTIIQTIMKIYIDVARVCPLLAAGTQVLLEGVRLTSEIAKSAGYVLKAGLGGNMGFGAEGNATVGLNL